MARRVGTVRVVFAADLQALQGQVEREVTNLTQALATCPTPPDIATMDSWANFSLIVNSWNDAVNVELASLLPEKSGQLFEQGLGLEATLRQNWYPRIAALGCSVGPLPAPPRQPPLSSDNPDSPLALLAPLEGLVKTLLFLMVAREVREWMR